jgi:iron complex outermembrane receptor protein
MCKRYPGQASALSAIASSLLLTCAQAAPADMGASAADDGTVDTLSPLPLEQLMQMRVVTTASRFAQQISDALSLSACNAGPAFVQATLPREGRTPVAKPDWRF